MHDSGVRANMKSFGARRLLNAVDFFNQVGATIGNPHPVCHGEETVKSAPVQFAKLLAAVVKAVHAFKNRQWILPSLLKGKPPGTG